MNGDTYQSAGGSEPPADRCVQDCPEARELFPEYLDGALSGRAMQSLSTHLDACKPCDRAFQDDRALQQVLADLGPLRAPERLQAQLQNALAAERERGTHLNMIGRIRRDWATSFAPFALRFTGGLAAAVLLLGSAALFFADNLPVQANDDRMANPVSPRYLYSEVPPRSVDRVEPLLVDAKIDSSGHVYDYQVLVGQMDADARLRVEQNLLSSVYQPATLFGAPVRGHVMVTFSGISVRG